LKNGKKDREGQKGWDGTDRRGEEMGEGEVNGGRGRVGGRIKGEEQEKKERKREGGKEGTAPEGNNTRRRRRRRKRRRRMATKMVVERADVGR